MPVPLLTRGHLSIPRRLIALLLRGTLARENPLALCRVLNCERTLTPPSNVYTSLKDEKNLLGMGYVGLLPTL